MTPFGLNKVLSKLPKVLKILNLEGVKLDQYSLVSLDNWLQGSIPGYMTSINMKNTKCGNFV
jgi:hypothetical protein